MSEEVNQEVMSEYQKKILAENHTFKMGKNFGEIGKNPYYSEGSTRHCEFCGHSIRWCFYINDETGKEWMIGSECVWNLLHLDEAKKNALKKAIARTSLIDRSLRKYANILQVIRNNGTTTTYKQMIADGKLEVLAREKDEVWVKLPEQIWHTKERYLESSVCKKHRVVWGNSVFNCVGCLSSEIIRKIMEVGTVNPFWFDKYEELTKSKLPEVKSLRKNKGDGKNG